MAATPPRRMSPSPDDDGDARAPFGLDDIAAGGLARPPSSPIGLDSRVIKTLRPGQPGALRWEARYGQQLVCVRYREDVWFSDPDSDPVRRSCITVELLVEQKQKRKQKRPAPAKARSRQAPPVSLSSASSSALPLVAVHIDPRDEDLRARAFATGATCDPYRPVWHMSPATAQHLGLSPIPPHRRPKT